MKLKVKQSLIYCGIVYNPGEVVDILESDIIERVKSLELVEAEEVVENDRKYFWSDIYKYLFRATTFAKFKKYSKIQENIDKVREEYNKLPDEEKAYDFYNVILKEVDELEEKLKEGEESIEKHIEAMEYKSLLAWKMEKLLKNKVK